jgi:hypothetical protein
MLCRWRLKDLTKSMSLFTTLTNDQSHNSSKAFYRLTHELMDRIMTYIRCSCDKQTFLESCEFAREMYVTSQEVERAFRTAVIDDDWIREDYQCRNGPCGPNASSSLYRAQCCFHPFNDEYNDGAVVYECCSYKCLREARHDIRTTHITTVYHRKLWEFGRCCTLLQVEGAPCSSCMKTVGMMPRFFKYRRARFVCLAGNSATGPTEHVQGRKLGVLRCSTYFFPMHIGVDISETPKHTLQVPYDSSFNGSRHFNGS